MTNLFDCCPEDRDELKNALKYGLIWDKLYDENRDADRATLWEKGADVHAAKETCCGVYEITHTCRSGRKYRLGCNYGH